MQPVKRKVKGVHVATLSLNAALYVVLNPHLIVLSPAVIILYMHICMRKNWVERQPNSLGPISYIEKYYVTIYIYNFLFSCIYSLPRLSGAIEKCLFFSWCRSSPECTWCGRGDDTLRSLKPSLRQQRSQPSWAPDAVSPTSVSCTIASIHLVELVIVMPCLSDWLFRPLAGICMQYWWSHKHGLHGFIANWVSESVFIYLQVHQIFSNAWIGG